MNLDTVTKEWARQYVPWGECPRCQRFDGLRLRREPLELVCMLCDRTLYSLSKKDPDHEHCDEVRRLAAEIVARLYYIAADSMPTSYMARHHLVQLVEDMRTADVRSEKAANSYRQTKEALYESDEQ